MNCFGLSYTTVNFFFLRYCIFRSRISFSFTVEISPTSNFQQLNEKTEVDNGQTVL